MCVLKCPYPIGNGIVVDCGDGVGSAETVNNDNNVCRAEMNVSMATNNTYLAVS